MKVALFTIWHEMNYGAEMQAYATIRALKELGHDVVIIDLRLDDIRKYSFKEWLVKKILFFSPAKRSFEQFWSNYFLNRIRYTSIKDLYAFPPSADVYLVGSDQTWNPQIMKSLISISVLDFGADNIIRASYASSFGINSWSFSEDLTNSIKKSLDKFKYISCREKTGCHILKQTFGINAVNTLDPTLLHENYNEITGEVKELPILAYYPLSVADKELQRYAIEIAKALNLKPVNINEGKKMIGSIIWDRTTIEEWIINIASSQFVLTKSFHGLAFSLIYKRQFAIVINNNKSSRIVDLLSALGLERRLFSNFKQLMDSKIWEEPIDYSKISPKLDILREQSWNFLKQMNI